MSVKAGPFLRRRGRRRVGAGLPGPVDRRCHWPDWPLGVGVCAHAPRAGSSSGRREQTPLLQFPVSLGYGGSC